MKGRRLLAVVLFLLVPLGGTAGCSYEYNEPARTPATGRQQAAESPAPYIDPLVLEREVQNYRELNRVLKAAPGTVILFEEGPLDGPARGFGTLAEVAVGGQYIVTAACAGATGARVAVGQELPGAPFRPTELALDCISVAMETIELQQGYVFAHLVLPGPGDTPWTGAVGGIRVTGGGLLQPVSPEAG